MLSFRTLRLSILLGSLSCSQMLSQATAATLSLGSGNNLLAGKAVVMSSVYPASPYNDPTMVTNSVYGNGDGLQDSIFDDFQATNSLVINGFNSGIGLIRYWGDPADTNRRPSSITASSSLNNNGAVTDTFETSLGTQALTDSSYPVGPTNYGLISLPVNAPAGTQSVKLDFGLPGTNGIAYGNRVTEVQAFAPNVVIQDNVLDTTQANGFYVPTRAEGNLARTATVSMAVGSPGPYASPGLSVINDGTTAGGLSQLLGFDGQVGANSPVVLYYFGNYPGYDISQISVYANWPDARTNQAFTVYSHHIGDPLDQAHFTALGSYSFLPNASGNNSTLVSLSNSTQNLLTGVDYVAIQFTDNFYYGSIGNNYTAYTEVAIMGVPEPSSLVLFGLAVPFVLRRRRK